MEISCVFKLQDVAELQRLTQALLISLHLKDQQGLEDDLERLRKEKEELRKEIDDLESAKRVVVVRNDLANSVAVTPSGGEMSD